MPRRKRNSARVSPKGFLLLTSSAVILFAGGQLVRVVGSDNGSMLLASHLGVAKGRAAEVIGAEIRRGLEAAGAGPDSVRETVADASPPHRWRVGLAPGTSALQCNHAITHYVESVGGVVHSGRERRERDGASRVTLVVGLPRSPTHEVILESPPQRGSQVDREPARLAIVLYGFGEDPENAKALFDLDIPFAAAVVPGAKWSGPMFRAAHDGRRELVLHLPLEPVNYPQVNPGPGTILVTMNPTHVTRELRRHLRQAGNVTCVANYMGSLATQDMTVMTSIFRELEREDLAFLHVDPAPGSVCPGLAADLGIPYEEPGAAFNPAHWSDARRTLRERWEQVLDTAREKRRLIVWMKASRTTLEWLPEATSAGRLDGVSLVPLSALMRGPIPL
jgi:polysaccharide deacetylase 2 family uncharacterized protein YibQ